MADQHLAGATELTGRLRREKGEKSRSTDAAAKLGLVRRRTDLSAYNDNTLTTRRGTSVRTEVRHVES